MSSTMRLPSPNLDDGRAIDLKSEDIVRVCGVPGTRDLGSEIKNIEARWHVPKLAVMFPFPHGKKGGKIQAARNALKSLKGKTYMSPNEESRFLCAFLLIAAEDLLAPRQESKGILDEVIEALENPAGPWSFNWADFTLRHLNEATRHLKAQLLRSPTPPHIYVQGCTLFLVV